MREGRDALVGDQRGTGADRGFAGWRSASVWTDLRSCEVSALADAQAFATRGASFRISSER